MYNFIPNSVSYSKNDLNLAIKYKNAFETLLNSNINFEELDKTIENTIGVLPEVNDKDHNFYHNYSTLNSKYLFLRNNIHVERLTNDEVEELQEKPSKDFLLETYPKVLYEEGDYTFCGNPYKETLVKSKSLYFELAYNVQDNFSFILEDDEIKKIANDFVNNKIKPLGFECSVILNNSISDPLKKSSETKTM